MRSRLQTLLFFSVAFLPLSKAELFLNEIRIDQNGADTDEYFEVYSNTAPETLDGVTLIVLGDGSGSGTVEAVVPLDGLSADPIVLVAEPGDPPLPNFATASPDLLTNLNFENGDNVTFLLVRGFSGADGDDLDTDDDGQLDAQPWTELLDGVGLRTPGDSSFEYSESLGIESNGPDGNFVPAHSFRPVDGRAGWEVGIFNVNDSNDTPGALNSPIAELSLVFDSDTIGEDALTAITATVSHDGDVDQPLEVTIGISDPTELAAPMTVIVPGDGSGQTTFLISPLDDGSADGDQLVEITVSAPDFFSSTGTITVTDDDDPATLVINEVNAEVEEGRDANGNGPTEFQGDEFIELVNISGAELDISNWTISDNEGVRHVFAAGTTLPTDCAVVVFGSGAAEGVIADFGSALVLNASSGALGLNDSGGDSIIVADTGGIERAGFAYEDVDGQDGSQTRDPDLTGAFVGHLGVTGSPFSPGFDLSGEPFCTPESSLEITITGPASFSEGAGEAVSMAEIERIGDTSGSLIVQLVSSDPSEATIEASVEFANGEESKSVAISAVDDPFVDGDQTVVFTANAEGLTSGQAQVVVTDDGADSEYVVINEIDARQPGDDRMEFIELYDGGIGNAPLDGYVVVLFNGADDEAIRAWDLDGFTTNADGFFVIGTLNEVPNADIEVFPLGAGFIQNGPGDAVALYSADASQFLEGTFPTADDLIDAVVYGGNAESSTLPATFGTGAENVPIDADDNESMSRLPDGGAPVNHASFADGFPTPGAANMGPDTGEGAYDAWAASFPGIGGRLDDDDFDGLPSILEFGLGFDPFEPDPLPDPVIDPGSGNLRLTVEKGAEAAADPDTAFFAATSTDGEEWSDVDLSVITNDATTFAVEYTGDAETALLRIGVNVAP